MENQDVQKRGRGRPRKVTTEPAGGHAPIHENEVKPDEVKPNEEVKQHNKDDLVHMLVASLIFNGSLLRRLREEI